MGKRIKLVCAIAVTVLALTACGKQNAEISESKAKELAQTALRDVLDVDESPNTMAATIYKNAYSGQEQSGSMTRESKEYWVINCSFEEKDAYQIWLDAGEGRLVHVSRYPIGWFHDAGNVSDYIERETLDPSELEIRNRAQNYCKKAGYEVIDSEEAIQTGNKILLKNPDDGRTEWKVDYYQVPVQYKDGTSGTIALFADDLSLLEGWFEPYQ